MISGAPGVGKTTIARPLARALGMPLFAKDSIKERIHDVLAATEPAGIAGVGTGPIGAGQVEAGPIGAGQVVAAQVKAAQVGTGQVEAGPIGAGQVVAGPIKAAQVGTGPIGAGPVGAAPVGAGPVKAAQVGTQPVEAGWSRRLGAAAMELLWVLAADAPECVLEANFWTGHERQNAALRALSEGGKLVEVHCTAPKEVVMQRFRERAAIGARHAVHPDQELTSERWEADFHGPIGIGTLLTVDTSTRVDVAQVAAEVRALLA
ncbi:hypothetical protein [Catenulispora sp. EB89]|uniref:hypothetical protein n=1 Tax=Catenulispora sp. EB89 TaxID=3156257 RepID=UPI003511E6D9